MTAFDDWRARSPYYDETHEALAQSVRRFVAREIAPYIDRWEAEGELPRDREIHVVCRSGQRAYYATRILLQNGFKARTVSGGMLSLAHKQLLDVTVER